MGGLFVGSVIAKPDSWGFGMGRRLPSMVLLIITNLAFLVTGASTALALQPAEAESLAAQSGRPLLAVVTSDTCPPCQALKHLLASDAAVRELTEKYVVLNLDNQSTDFQAFLAQHPADYQGVPMVFVLRPDGAMLYGQSGGMTAHGLSDLLKFGLQESGRSLSSEEQARFVNNFNKSNQLLQQGELLAALQMTDAGQIEHCFAKIVLRTRTVRTLLLDEIANRMSRLDARMLSPETMHGAAFRLAEFQAKLSDGPHRETANAMLAHYTAQPSTRMAVAQGVQLVEARELERFGSFDAALARYERIITLDETTPTADHALQKLPIIKARIRKATASRTN